MRALTLKLIAALFILSLTLKSNDAFSYARSIKTSSYYSSSNVHDVQQRKRGFGRGAAASIASSSVVLPKSKEGLKVALHLRGGAGDVISSPSILSKASSIVTASIASLSTSLSSISKSPQSAFNAALLVLGIGTAVLKLSERGGDSSKATTTTTNAVEKEEEKKPDSIRKLQIRFLMVFWLLRCADWLQGPYFYEVYASKNFGLSWISRLFLTGFASTAVFGPFVGSFSDKYGRKLGTLAFTLFYALGALSTRSSVLTFLLLGRVCSGVGTSLLFSAPESWLVGESQREDGCGKDDPNGKYLGETFGLAYAGDSIVAILAGQLAGLAAGKRGPTGPFELSIGFLVTGALLASFLWRENVASSSSSSSNENSNPGILEAIEVTRKDPKILLVGSVQSLFEAAMYIFVLQWPPALGGAITGAFGKSSIPYGTVFSCFMACCLLGSTTFGRLAKMSVPTETFGSAMLVLATLAMGLASRCAVSNTAPPFWMLTLAFFVFEGCVGTYFPTIGTLRSKYVPDSHRGVIMNLFGIPLNILVVSVFLSIKALGVNGALTVSTVSLGLASLCMIKLRSIVGKGHDGEKVTG